MQGRDAAPPKFRAVAPDVLARLCVLLSKKTPEDVVEYLKSECKSKREYGKIKSKYRKKNFYEEIEAIRTQLYEIKKKGFPNKTLQRIFDFGLLYTEFLKRARKAKLTGKALEHVVSSLAKECGLDVEHVDLPFGDLLLGRHGEPVALVECKATLQIGKSLMDYKRVAISIKNQRLGETLPNVRLILLGGRIERHPDKHVDSIHKIRKELENVGCRFFIIWDDYYFTGIDDSFSKFFSLVRKLASKKHD